MSADIGVRGRTAVAAAPARPVVRRSRSRLQRRMTIARFIVALIVSLVMLFPFYWMIVVSLSPRGQLFTDRFALWPTGISFDNFAAVVTDFPIAEWFQNSVVITVFVTVISTFANLLAGYAFAKLRFLGRNAMFFAALATLVLPVQVTMVAQLKLVTDLGIYGTYWAVIFPSAATATGIFLARQFIIAIPDELLEAAKIDGAGHLRLFRAIVLPLCRPLIAVLIVLTAMAVWNDFAWPLIALKQNALFTLPVGLLFLQGQNTPQFENIMALSIISVAPMVVLFLVFQRYFVQGIARTGIK